MNRLAGKVAVIAGASQGMGEAHARMFVAHDAKVILTDVSADRGLTLANGLGKH